MLAAGVDLKVVQHLLRHSSIKVTMDLYTNVAQEVAADAARELASAIPPGRPRCTVPAPSGSQETTMDGRPPDNPRANSTKPQVTSTGDLGPEVGRQGFEP
ncbi:hypothetical protein [Amycolatopsis sp. cg13]|uniref:hypothetical protein n=1 Tax=Amycolatopsis sp. cg13 TaxID=3238807 RepID=UPI0035239314